MTEPTTIQVKAVNPRPAAVRPEKPVVHLRPVLALAGNVVAGTTEAVFAVGGGAALAAVAGVAVGVPVIVGAARRLQPSTGSRSNRETSSTRRSGGGRSGSGRSGSTGGGQAASRRLRGLLGGGAVASGSTGRRSTGGGSGSGGGRKSGRSGNPPATGRLRRALGALGLGALGTAKAADRGLDRAAEADRGAAKRLWQKVRQQFTSKPEAGEIVPAAPATPNAKSKVATTVKGGKAAVPAAKTPAPTPNPAPLTGPIKPPALTAPAVQLVSASGGIMTGGPAASAMKALLDIVENDMRRIANNYDPEGIEEVLAEYAMWPQVLDALGGVWKIMVQKAEDDYPLPASGAAVVGEIQRHQNSVARAAEAVPGLVRAIIKDRLDEMADRRNAMYDHRVNPNTAAM